jgi:glycerol-3-phosphate acyltransferase PlsX
LVDADTAIFDVMVSNMTLGEPGTNRLVGFAVDTITPSVLSVTDTDGIFTTLVDENFPGGIGSVEFYRALMNVDKPTVGLLNVGAEDLKGHELIRTAARVLRESDPDMAFKGFVEGNDISKGTVDVVVTDGFTGNVALKSAEGAARLLGGWMKETLTGTLNAKLGALMMAPGLRKLKDRIDPSSNNGGVFLGVNGIVVKSHGGANARGVASAVNMAASLAGRPFRDEVTATVKAVMIRRQRMAGDVAEETTIKAAAV